MAASSNWPIRITATAKPRSGLPGAPSWRTGASASTETRCSWTRRIGAVTARPDSRGIARLTASQRIASEAMSKPIARMLVSCGTM